jgi:hypothetical protein
MVAHTKKGGIMDLKELIEKYKAEDGKINYEEAETAFQTHVNGIVTKNVKKEVGKKEAEVMSNFISELGIEAEDIDGVKKWVGVMNNNTDDFKKTNVKLQSELEKALQGNQALKTEYTTFKQDTLLNSVGVKGEQADFLKYKFNKNISDDVTFESQLEEWKKENKVTTNKFVEQNFNDTADEDHVAALKRLRQK